MPTFEQFRMPDAGEGLTEAEVVQWHVAVGDTVTVNQVILEVETAKSLVDLPSPFTGVVTEIHGDQGDVVEVGTVIMVVDTDPDGQPAASDSSPESVGAPVPATASPERADVAGAGADAPETAGEADSDSGSVLVGYGTVHGATTRRARRAPAAQASHTQAVAPSRDTLTVNRPAGAEAVRAKPPVRKLAKELGLDLSAVAPTGPGGIITREDVMAAHERTNTSRLTAYSAQSASSGQRACRGQSAPVTPARSVATADAPGHEPVTEETVADAPWLASGVVSPDGRQTAVPVRSVRRRTAEVMVTSAFTAPHVTVFHTVDVTKTMKLVERLRADREFADVRVTPLLITAKALLLAVARHPEINASWLDEDETIVYKHYVNLGIAAATPRGLVVPNVKNAHRLSLKGLAQGIADLTATARAGKTSPTDMSDGTITITNVGVFGIDTGTPILNPGESAILAFGAIRQQPWVHKGKIKKRWVTQLALSFDHRLVDGELGARVLADIAKVLEDPSHGLVWA